MPIQIIGDVDTERVYCAGSFTKLLTTFVSLSLLSEKYELSVILDDIHFFDTLCVTPEAQSFLHLFQKILGNKFTLHDICSYYAGLPYTFDLADEELLNVEAGYPFKHHCVAAEEDFLARCNNMVTYQIAYAKNRYAVLGADRLTNIAVNFYEALSGHRYMLFDGTLYKKFSD